MRRLDTNHRRRQALRAAQERARRLGRLTKAGLGVVVLVGGAATAVHLTRPDAPGLTTVARPVATTAPARSEDASFTAAIARICAAVNAANADVVHDSRALKRKFAGTRSATVAEAAAIKLVDSLTNALMDQTTTLSAVAPPEALKAAYQRALGALTRNVGWTQRYSNALSDAGSPLEVSRVLRVFEHQVPRYQADRTRLRAELLRMGGGDCQLDKTPTIDPVMPPRFYASGPGAISAGAGAGPRPASAVLGAPIRASGTSKFPIPPGTEVAPSQETRSDSKREDTGGASRMPIAAGLG